MLLIRKCINHCFIGKHRQFFYLSLETSQFRNVTSDKEGRKDKGREDALSLLNRLKSMVEKAWKQDSPEGSELDAISGKGKEMRMAELEMLESMRNYDKKAISQSAPVSRSGRESSKSDAKQD
jgi:hypothetical protein